MIRLGLTGSIGMGKTTTATMFRDAGCAVFDADAAVHNLYNRGGGAVPLIQAVFPDAIKDGAVERMVLGQHMRKDPLNLGVLESFIHPMVANLRREFTQAAEAQGHDIAVFDVPLLFETGGAAYVDKVAVVSAPKDVQRKRVMARNGMSKGLFESLLSRQMSDFEKKARADYIIFSNRGLDFAREQVHKIIEELKQQAKKTGK